MILINWIVVVLSLTFASNVFATISCSEPKLSNVTSHDSIYHFKTVVTCKLVGETINLKTLKDAYRDEITAHSSQFVVHSQKAYDNKKGMSGYQLDATQSYNTANGDVVVHAIILLADDNSKNFYMELRSKSVVGQDDAKYNRSIVNEIMLNVAPDHADLTSIKEIDVEEPWYAPESTFFDTVETELLEASRKAALLQAEKICGQKVDAMRK